MRILKIFIAALAVLIIMPGCSSHRANTQQQDSGFTGKQGSVDSRFNSLVESYPGWKSFYAPATINIESPQNLSVSSRITMIRDSMIHISLRMIGMELAVVHVNTDSIFVVDKYHKYIFKEGLAKVMAKYPITLANIQDIIIGRIFVSGKPTISPSDIKYFSLSADKKNDIWFAYPSQKIENVSWHFDVSGKPMYVNTLSFFHPSGSNVTVRYSDAQNTPIGYAPSEIDVRAPLSALTAQASIRMNLSSVRVDKDNDFQWQPPTGYTQLSIDQIKQMFKL